MYLNNVYLHNAGGNLYRTHECSVPKYRCDGNCHECAYGGDILHITVLQDVADFTDKIVDVN